MNPLIESLRIPLPLYKKEILENPRDWVAFWETLASRGSSLLLESAGPINDASRWVILAGDPQQEYYEKSGQAWIKDSSGPRPASLGIFEFLDQIGGHRSAHELGKARSFGGGINPVPPEESRFNPLPFCFSEAWFGVFSYEFGRSFNIRESKVNPSKVPIVPDYYFFKPGTVAAYDRLSKEIYYFGQGTLEPSEILGKAFEVQSLESRSTLAGYKAMVEKVKEFISKGDIYQANIAQAFRAVWKGNVGNLYRRLREMNPGPFMGILQFDGIRLVSSSPERLVAGWGDWLETRPIAGTRPRGRDSIQDLRLKLELKTSPKEQAEHLMLVDLARNDMGRIADYGTVEVNRFADVETYSKVQHLVSVVRARKRGRSGVSDILKSLFPGGTITGCPKVRCMEIIEETEPRARGYYTGSMGYVAPGPGLDLNILIRSLTLFPGGELEFNAGAGIVADSDPEKEYMETLYKAEALARALGSSFLEDRV